MEFPHVYDYEYFNMNIPFAYRQPYFETLLRCYGNTKYSNSEQNLFGKLEFVNFVVSMIILRWIFYDISSLEVSSRVTWEDADDYIKE